MQFDAIHCKFLGRKMYALTAIDRASRIAYAKVFSKLNSQISTEFLKEVIKESPYKIKAIQTDNGLEFEKKFDEYVRYKKITHYYNYPHSPKSNAIITIIRIVQKVMLILKDLTEQLKNSFLIIWKM